MKIADLSSALVRNTPWFVAAAAVVSYLFPSAFIGVHGVTAKLVLGFIMLTMGMTLTADDFRAAIVWAADGPRVSWSPDLRTAAQPRVYTVLGRERLGDGAWTSPVDARHRFFKVRVEMAPR